VPLERVLFVVLTGFLVLSPALASNSLPSWSSFLQQPVVPRGSPSVIDDLQPPAVAAASEALLQVDVAKSAQLAELDACYYTVHVSKVLFAHHPLPSSLVVQTDCEVIIPAGRYVMGVTAIPASSPPHKIAPYRLTWRVTGVGQVSEDSVVFRARHGPGYSYAINSPSSWIGCFYRSSSNECRIALLARYRITSSRQRRVFEQILAGDPFAGLLWARAATTTSHLFPTVLCSSNILDNCASRQMFAQMIDFQPGM